MNDVFVLKLINGDEIIAEVNNEGGIYVIKNPVALAVDGSGKVGFAPWFPISKKGNEINIDADKVIAISEPATEIRDAYASMFGKIVTPEPQIITG